MNILTHPVHTGYQYDLSFTGHEFYSVDVPGSGEVFWDHRSRPQPNNFHLLRDLKDAPVRFDLILVHFDAGYVLLEKLDLPMIYKEHCLRDPYQVSDAQLQRIDFYCFAGSAAADRWIVPPDFLSRKVIIGMGMNQVDYNGYSGEKKAVLVVGQNIASRGTEKGAENLARLIKVLPIIVVGNGSERFAGSPGPAKDYCDLISYYQKYRVFLNPSDTLGMSTLEAMATGMPVVTFRTLNSDIIQNGVNGFVVDNVDEAEQALLQILDDENLASFLGSNARRTIKERFSHGLFIQRWDTLFRRAVYEYRPRAEFKMYQPFTIQNKPPGERKLAESVINKLFEYRRIGFDQRPMTFLPNGCVGIGSAGCEKLWDVRIDGDVKYLDILSPNSTTCTLKLDSDGAWKGRWNHHEKMPIVLSPTRDAT